MRINTLSLNRCVSFLVLCAMIMAVTSPLKAADNTFSSKEFLGWDRQQQDFYIKVSVGMAALIAVPNDKKQADCIDKWYYPAQDQRNDFILGVMRDNPEYHPHGVLIGVLQKNCGEFKYR